MELDSGSSDDEFDDVSDSDSIMVPNYDMKPGPNAQVLVDENTAHGGWGCNRDDVLHIPHVLHHWVGGGWGHECPFAPFNGAGDNPQGGGD